MLLKLFSGNLGKLPPQHVLTQLFLALGESLEPIKTLSIQAASSSCSCSPTPHKEFISRALRGFFFGFCVQEKPHSLPLAAPEDAQPGPGSVTSQSQSPWQGLQKAWREQELLDFLGVCLKNLEIQGNPTGAGAGLCLRALCPLFSSWSGPIPAVPAILPFPCPAQFMQHLNNELHGHCGIYSTRGRLLAKALDNSHK